VLSERGTVAVDERTNQLIVKDIQKGHEEANQLIKKLDLRTPQVLLETQIVEATSDFLRQLGFQWNFSYVASPETGNPTGQVFPNAIQNDFGFSNLGGAPTSNMISAILDSADGARALTAKLQQFEQEGRAKIISRPQVATVNNKQAEIKSVQTIRVKLPDSGLSVATGQGASASGAGQSAFQEINIGIELKVTPQASPDYYVLMDIDAKSSTLGNLEVDSIPSTIERRATSTILVKSGQTFALGGVYRIKDNNDVSGVPWMKDIPVLGYLFRYQEFRNGDEELIFFITPHIVEGSFDPSLM
jgi:type IV pilus assembly protein PilQ